MAATRLPHPWDSPGKNTGVGCHFLLQCRKVKSQSEVSQSCLTLRDPMDCSLPGSMGFSRQEYWSGVPLPSPYFHLVQCIFLIYLKTSFLTVDTSKYMVLFLSVWRISYYFSVIEFHLGWRIYCTCFHFF